MAQAHIWQRDPEPIADIVGEEVADIVVVGAGIAGCTAAQSAAEAGASVIVIEKFDKPTAHGSDIGAINSIVQEREGIHIDPLEAARLVYNWSQQQASYNMIRLWAERSGEVMSHYVRMAEDKGFKVRINVEFTARADWTDLDERYRILRTPHIFDIPEGSGTNHGWHVGNFVKVVSDDAIEHGARFMYNTPALRLVRVDAEGNPSKAPDARVTGVVVETPEGNKLIRANKGVILATGGISDNFEMMECFCPIALRVDSNDYFPKGGNMGDGHVMSKWVGAAFSRCYPAPIIHPVSFTVLAPGMSTSWLAVNRDGKRFMNEMAYEPAVTNARMSAPGNVAWAIFDSDYLEHIAKQEPTVYAALPADVVEQVEQAVEKGDYLRADTLAELAEAMGVPADTFEETVERYNGYVDAGYDPEFGVPERFLSPCRKGPFYASRITALLLSVPYGMNANDNLQLCDEADEPIPGLYAAGNMAGGFFANSYPVACPGVDHGRSVTLGCLLGRALAAGENIDGTPAA